MLFAEENIKKYNLRITKSGNFWNPIIKQTYHYHYACDVCGYPYLHSKKNGKFCTKKCAKIGKNNGMFGRTGELNPMFGNGYLVAGELNSMFGKTGALSPGWKGGVSIKNIPLYDTYAHQLEPYEKCTHDPEDPTILNVFCTYSGCKKQYRPTREEVNSRIGGINSNDTHKFYCCDECKQSCSLFRQSAQSLMETDAENAGRITKLNQQHIRTNQKTNKKRRYIENGGICDWCGIKVMPKTSILHHEVPVKTNFLVTDDLDNHWLFCIECDKKAHSLLGCSYNKIKNRKMCKVGLP